MTAPEDEFRDRMLIEADLASALLDHVADLPYAITLGGEKFRAAYPGDVPGFKFGDDVVLLRREPDGKVFEVDIDVSVRPVPTEAERAEAAGQLPLPEVPG